MAVPNIARFEYKQATKVRGGHVGFEGFYQDDVQQDVISFFSIVRNRAIRDLLTDVESFLIRFSQPEVTVTSVKLFFKLLSGRGAYDLISDVEPIFKLLSERERTISSFTHASIAQFPSANLYMRLVEDTRRYRQEVMTYTSLAREAGEASAVNALDSEENQGIDPATARYALNETVRDLVHLFAASFPDVDVPQPVKLTVKRQFTLPVREFFRARLMVEDEAQFMDVMLRELWPLAQAEKIRSGRGTLTVYADELAIRVTRQRPLSPASSFQVPEGWEPARAPRENSADR